MEKKGLSPFAEARLGVHTRAHDAPWLLLV